MVPFLLVLGGCGAGATDTVSYTDPEKLSLVNLPSEWHFYEIDELSALGQVPFAESYAGFDFPAVTSMAFDGAPARDVTNVTSALATATYPIGAMNVRTVGEVERQFLNRATLSQSVLPYFQFLDAQEHLREDFSFGDGYDGVRVLVSYSDDTGAEVGVAYLISVTDPADNRIYSIVAGCSRQCYIDNQTQIERVVDSWLVNKRTS
ncbi:MAG TPA: hypothetical protein VLA54_01955 [Acidimicrobiia bacterium]|nr:hypothetical protein [Acidimicrobiia bacterium]